MTKVREQHLHLWPVVFEPGTRGGQTALHLTSQSNNRETLELLLAHPDIDPAITNNQVIIERVLPGNILILIFSSGRPGC